GYPVETEANEVTETYEFAALETGETDAVAIAQERAQAFLAEWKPTIGADALFENMNDGDASNDPFVLSVRSEEHYALGHLAGAFNANPWRQVATAENLAHMPTDKQIVSYCYTGHTGQVAATVLGLLGYDVTNLKFGMMGWTDDAGVLATAPFEAAAGFPVESAAGVASGDEFATLADHISAQLAEWKPVITADALFENLNDGDETNDPFVLSVRSREHYELGHVPGAYNIPWRGVADPQSLASLPTDRQIVVYCYTGHTGQVAASILNFLGYDATNLKFGMMGWTDDTEVLATTPFAAAPGYPVEIEANELAETYDPPTLATGEATAVAIAQARAQSFLEEWKPVVGADALFENLNDGDETNDPFVLSVRSGEHYEVGHIAGAYNIPWREVANAENLAYLPTDQQIVDYCYTGHTGQVAATALALLGYDATNLKFGMMGWTDDAEVLATTPFAAAAGYPVETEVNELVGAPGEGDALAELITERLSEWSPVISAEALFENLSDGDEANDPFIVSVRSPEHYDVGHIPGAYNIPWRAIADSDSLAMLPADEPIVVYCYTGHTGQVAATILNFMGYDVTNLKFGMMGWTDDTDVLATTPFAAAAGYPVEAEATELVETYAAPELDVAEREATVIVQARAQALLADWKPTVSADGLYENLTDGDETNDPFILSVRSAEHYALGHIADAYNIPWREVATPGNLAYLPTEQQIVDYCYTGHTGQVAATALGLLGYDVTNLKFGMMGWTDDAEVLATQPFVAAGGYPTE
ncbi:MAG: rhodanese-like domain-containing protein, partial [Anaerolineae bacterium]